MATKKKNRKNKSRSSGDISTGVDLAVAELASEATQLDVSIAELVEDKAPESNHISITSLDLETAAQEIKDRLGGAVVTINYDTQELLILDTPDKIKETFATANRVALALRKEGRIQNLPKIIK